MEDALMALIIIPTIFIGMPWIILHYITQWKKSSGISREDESLLEDLYETARRLEDRLHTVERIVVAENPELGNRRVAAEELPRADIRKIREI